MRQRKHRIALLLIAWIHQSVWSTEVFRCGSQFSDLPCSHSASATQIDDTRTRAQQRQGQEATQQQQAAAQSLQGQRLRHDQAARDAQRLASLAPQTPQAPSQAEAPVPVLRARKHHGPPTAHFTARSADAAPQSKKQ